MISSGDPSVSRIASKAFTLTPDSPRALSAKEYADTLTGAGIEAVSFDTLSDALNTAMKEAKKDNTPLICLGSLYVYSSLMDVLENIE